MVIYYFKTHCLFITLYLHILPVEFNTAKCYEICANVASRNGDTMNSFPSQLRHRCFNGNHVTSLTSNSVR